MLVGLVAGLILAGIFRQLFPLFISTRNPEGTLLFLLPIIRPFFPGDGVSLPILFRACSIARGATRTR